MQEMRDYQAGGGCGHVMIARWRDGKLTDRDEEDDPGAIELGQYFEFILSGALPKSGVVPKPQYMSTAIKKNGNKTDGLGVADMYAEYRLAHTNADRVRRYLQRMRLKVVHVGKKLTKGRFEGTMDLIVEVQGEDGQQPGDVAREFANGIVWRVGDLLVIDLKYSGMLNKGDRRNKHGWQWSDVQKEYHGTQAIQYHFVSGLPFYFLVTSNSNEEDCELFYIPITQRMIDNHISEGNHLVEKFEFYLEVGLLEPRPSLKKCTGCPLKETCEDKHTFPHPVIVDLT